MWRPRWPACVGTQARWLVGVPTHAGLLTATCPGMVGYKVLPPPLSLLPSRPHPSTLCLPPPPGRRQRHQSAPSRLVPPWPPYAHRPLARRRRHPTNVDATHCPDRAMPCDPSLAIATRLTSMPPTAPIPSIDPSPADATRLPSTPPTRSSRLCVQQPTPSSDCHAPSRIVKMSAAAAATVTRCSDDAIGTWPPPIDTNQVSASICCLLPPSDNIGADVSPFSAIASVLDPPSATATPRLPGSVSSPLPPSLYRGTLTICFYPFFRCCRGLAMLTIPLTFNLQPSPLPSPPLPSPMTSSKLRPSHAAQAIRTSPAAATTAAQRPAYYAATQVVAYVVYGLLSSTLIDGSRMP
ncbi:uncharacterized protein PSFLO_04183 [Pseudozyma flocculosa]|uniref:Uncharacterized protein n=1 Tax=Pseudozyma flocculosa TaxID=84751 RepID=A0A5C3F2J4_9BASI|nr:uncharacterized protein PSFLO_04183 [Pseudozyma flocculosa]